MNSSPPPPPPRWATRLLQWHCHPELLEEIQGDLYEAYADRVARHGVGYARWRYVRDVLKFIRPFARESPNAPAAPASRIELLKNYGHMSVRYLQKHRGFFVLNVLGLAIGIAACLIIVHHVRFELSYDRHHQHADRIYRVGATLHSPDSEDPIAPTAYGLAPALAEQFSEVEAAARLVPTGAVVRDPDGSLFNENYFYQADPEVFDIFTYRLLAGDPAKALAAPHSVVLSQTMAKKYFGQTNPSSLMGTSLVINDKVYQLTGILEDQPRNSDLRVDALLSWQYNPDEWFDIGSYTYLLLKDIHSAAALQKKLPSFDEAQVNPRVAQDWGSDDITLSHALYPLTDLHYTTHLMGDTENKGNKTYVYIFSLAALCILIVAAINYVNLFVAQAGRRSVAVGVCQVMGAGRGQLWRQYMSECLITTLTAILVAVGCVLLVGQHFAELLGEPISWQTFTQPGPLYLLLGILVSVNLLAGSYPALALASLSPVQALKGGPLLPRRRGRLRQALIVLQFTVAIGLIAATLVVRDQLTYMRHKDLGFQQAQTLSIIIPDDTAAQQKVPLLKQTLLQDSRIKKATMGSRPDALWFVATFTVTVDGQPKQLSASGIPVDEDYLDALDISLVAGRDFTSSGADQIIVNEAFVKKVGWKNPIGQTVAFSATDRKEVVGVVRNFHYAPLRDKIEPLILSYDTSTPINLLVRVAPPDLDVIRAAWPAIFPNAPLEYEFLDTTFDRKYQTEQRMLTLFNYFSGLSLLVACLGLLGLTATIVQQKTKEIGIRKVLGAGRTTILYLLSREFGVLLLLSALLATPLAYLAMRYWLQSFAYQTGISTLVFLLSTGVVALLALLTLSYHTLKAAATNPVDSLRHE